jgi:DNA-binding transcriptional ArsR family regulator
MDFIFNYMVEYNPEILDKAFAALGNLTRRAILEQLAVRGATVLEIAKPFDMSLNAVSKHLKILEKAGLIRREIRGRNHYCYLEHEPLRQASQWIEHYRQFWEKRLDSLETFLTSQKAERKQKHRKP